MAVKTHLTKSKYQFCSVCGGLLLPKDHKKYLQCISCGRRIEIHDKKIISGYTSNTDKKSKREMNEKKRALKTPNIEDHPNKSVSITEDEREAMEDLFLKE